MIITEQTAVGDVAAAIPESVRVFERHGLDFCCGGRTPLAVACDEAGLSFADIAQEISAEITPAVLAAPDWTAEPLPRLIDHIVSTYHDALRREVPRLRELADKVAQVHGSKGPGLERIRLIVDALGHDLLTHVLKEEVVLFPAIRRLAAGLPATLPLGASIAVIEAEHDDAGALLRELRTLTDDYVPPTWACGSVRTLYSQLEQLEHALHIHVHLENNVLFARALGGRPVSAAK